MRRLSQHRSSDAQQRRLRGSVAGAHCFLNRRSRILRFSKWSGASHATQLATPPGPRARAFCACRMRATPAAAPDMPRLHHAARVATRSVSCGHYHTADARLDAAPASRRDRRGSCPPHRPPSIGARIRCSSSGSPIGRADGIGTAESPTLKEASDRRDELAVPPHDRGMTVRRLSPVTQCCYVRSPNSLNAANSRRTGWSWRRFGPTTSWPASMSRFRPDASFYGITMGTPIWRIRKP